MSLRFTPKTEAELKDPVLPAGQYDATIKKAEETVSKNTGFDMIALQLAVYDDAGDTYWVRDWLMTDGKTEKSRKAAQRKLKACVEQCGLEVQYAEGELGASDFVGRDLRVNIKIQSSPEYGEQNTVGGYPACDSTTSAPAPKREPAMASHSDADSPF